MLSTHTHGGSGRRLNESLYSTDSIFWAFPNVLPRQRPRLSVELVGILSEQRKPWEADNDCMTELPWITTSARLRKPGRTWQPGILAPQVGGAISDLLQKLTDATIACTHGMQFSC